MIAVSLQFFGSNQHTSGKGPQGKLSECIPRNIPGWIGISVPLAETDEQTKVIESVLRYDDIFSHRYRKGDWEISVYAAYWDAGTTTPRLVGAHTPDICWVQNGWQCRHRDSAVRLTIGTRTMLPAEQRTFEMRGTVLHVLFWHIVGTKVYTYRQEGRHTLMAPLQDLLSFGLNQRQPQLFVRLASNRRFEDVWPDPGVQVLLEQLAHLGVADAPPTYAEKETR